MSNCASKYFSNSSSINTRCYTDFSQVLSCYLNEPENVFFWRLSTSYYNDNSKITINTYMLQSQIWPKNALEKFGNNLWKHKLNIYIPEQVIHQTALLFVNGGYTSDKSGIHSFTDPREQADFSLIAKSNQAIVAEIQDVPNQYLLFSEDILPRKEDEILAYSYKKVINNPFQNAYWSGHLPMTKSIVKAMDAVQEIMTNDYRVYIEDFLIAGASKRGWAAWLTALGDDRVSAIIPINIDVLNVQKNIKHICDSYNGICPFALRDYIKEGVIDKLQTPEAAKLMQIEDPFSYINDRDYKDRLKILKYIINSGGDDFSVPDSSHFYFQQLPGDTNLLRYVPNTSHYVDAATLNDSLNVYFHLFLNCYQAPVQTWQFSDNKFYITTSYVPSLAILWAAENPSARDFRYNKYPDGGNIHYKPYEVSYSCEEHTACIIEASPPNLQNGWQASFVELSYKIGEHTLILTTEVEISYNHN